MKNLKNKTKQKKEGGRSVPPSGASGFGRRLATFSAALSIFTSSHRK